MDCRTPGLPVHQQLPGLAQAHVHLVADAIQPSHPLSSPSSPAFKLYQVFACESVLPIRWPKYSSFSFSISPSNEYSGTGMNAMNCSPPGFFVHGILPGKDTGVGWHFLLQGILLTQGLNLCLLHWQADSFFFYYYFFILFFGRRILYQ